MEDKLLGQSTEQTPAPAATDAVRYLKLAQEKTDAASAGVNPMLIELQKIICDSNERIAAMQAATAAQIREDSAKEAEKMRLHAESLARLNGEMQQSLARLSAESSASSTRFSQQCAMAIERSRQMAAVNHQLLVQQLQQQSAQRELGSKVVGVVAEGIVRSVFK